MTDHSALIERLEAAVSREGKPRGDHMIGAYAAFAVSALESGDEDQVELASVYDAASRCIANETAMFDAVAAVAEEAAKALRDLTAGDVVVVPIEPTNAMLQGACKSHTPGMSMGADRFGRVSGECPSFDRRRRIWADMISRYLPSAPNQAKGAGE